MNKEWTMVFLAGLFEVVWVTGLKHADNALEWVGTIVCIAISFYVLITASKHLPVGTVYAVFVGLGTAGTVLADIVFFSEPMHMVKLGLIAVLLVGVMGLKLVTDDSNEQRGEG